MKRIAAVMLLVVAALVLTFGAVVAANSKTVYRTELSGAATDSSGHGNAVFMFADDGSSMKYKLVVNGLNNTTQAHIHVAAVPGGNGPIVLWLYPDGPPLSLIEGIFNGLLGGRTVTSADLTGAAGIATLEDLRAAIEDGRAYVNVHTTLFPGGEIRGNF
ncbi:MAG: CHRD domain-containing protein [Caldilineaceae bacterium]|nr:CHRD domain-containing protein [Caldilineaceae bacterium]